jgi:NAD(P)-dependent dehydrogenase (short-subunit alcohol dehydrogenase family)
MPELFDLQGRVALVTGATGGLGQAIVRRLVEHGARVAAADRDLAACDQLAATLGRERVHALAVDLSRRDGAPRLAEAALAHFGQVDVLVCNAGMQGPAGPLHAVDDAAWDTTFQVNLHSAQALAAALVPGMAQRGGGSVILMASLAALRGNKAIGLYGMTKAALAQLARNLAVEWGPHNVRANAIAPGVIRTPFAAGLMADDTFMARRLAATPLRRVGEPDEVAGVAVMLASRAGAFITGQTLVVDGGTLISDGG